MINIFEMTVCVGIQFDSVVCSIMTKISVVLIRTRLTLLYYVKSSLYFL